MNEDTLIAIFRFILSFNEEHGFVPTQREIAEACYVSKGTVYRALKELEARAWVERHGRQYRNISIKFENLGQMSVNFQN